MRITTYLKIKALNVVEFLIRSGSERCVFALNEQIFQFRTLQDFSIYEKGHEKGNLSKYLPY